MAKTSFIFINLIDPLHNGAGQGLGYIDRPIMRERVTEFPIIQARTIKGVLRNEYDKNWSMPVDKQNIMALFGPEPGKGDEHSGAISFGEGQLLAFPIRSLKGCFVWATSPFILHRFREKAVNIAGIRLTHIDSVISETMEIDEPMIPKNSGDALLIGDPPSDGQPDYRQLLLEEYAYQVKLSKNLENFAAEIAGKIFAASSFLDGWFKKRLLILPDDSFRYFITKATEVMPNIRIGSEGTTEDGSLRYTEYLPRESILYSFFIHEKTRGQVVMDDNGVKSVFDGSLPGRIQIGGDETTGKGLVSLIKAS